DAHSACRLAEDHRHRGTERRDILDRRYRRDRHHRRLPGGAVMARALINVPPKAKKGDVIAIKTLIAHDMDTGFRFDNVGKVIPRNIITTFVCRYNDVEVFRADLHPAISANPYIAFSTVATESGTITFQWTGDNDFSSTESVNIVVE